MAAHIDDTMDWIQNLFASLCYLPAASIQGTAHYRDSDVMVSIKSTDNVSQHIMQVMQSEWIMKVMSNIICTVELPQFSVLFLMPLACA